MKQITSARNQEMLERFRFRSFSTNDVPLLCSLNHIIGDEIVVLDSFEAQGYELDSRRLDAERLLLQTLTDKSKIEVDKENLPSGCELVGDPLKVSFLDVKKLRERYGSITCSDDYEFDFTKRNLNFEAHLISELEAFTLANRLHNSSCIANKEIPHFVLSDGSERGIIFSGFKRSKERTSTFSGQYLGPLSHKTVEILSINASSMRPLNLDCAFCRCTYDLLGDMVVLKNSDFIPSLFLMQAKWELPLETLIQKTVASQKSVKKLSPDFSLLHIPAFSNNVPALIRFKPGWMDRRLGFTDILHELNYLVGLAASLKDGQIPWDESKKESEKTSQFILNRVKELIEGNRRRSIGSEVINSLDFIDRLWDCVKIVRSVETLRRSFQMIYNELQTGDFRAFVRLKKTSSLAKMIRTANPSDIIFMRLEPMICLQMLVELGLDRFQTELTNLFIKEQLLPNVGDLEPSFLNPLMHPIEDCISRQVLILLALQSMSVMERFIQFIAYERTNMTKRLLTHFTSCTQNDVFEKEFTFNVNMDNFSREGILDKLSEWTLERIFYSNPVYVDESRGSQPVAELREIIHLTRSLGFKYIAPKQKEIREDQQSSPNNTSKNQQHFSTTTTPNVNPLMNATSLISNLSIFDKTTLANVELPQKNFSTVRNQDDFECVYITVSSHSSSLFHK